MSAPISYKDPIYDQLDTQNSARVGIPEGLLHSIRLHGERSNANQVSSAGARTVYQIIPKTRIQVIKKYGIDPYLSPENASLASAYLLKEDLNASGGDPHGAATKYTGGYNPKKYGPETRSYANRVMNAFNLISSAQASDTVAQGTPAYRDSNDISDFTPEELAQLDAMMQGEQKTEPISTAAPVSTEEPAQKERDPLDTSDFTPEELAQLDELLAAPEETDNPSLPSTIVGAGMNAIPSTVKGLGNLAEAVMNPIDTATTLFKLVVGAGQNTMGMKLTNFLNSLGLPTVDGRPIAKANVDDYIKAYGGEANIKRTVRDDPFRVFADLTTVFSLGSKILDIAGEAGTAAKVLNVADKVNPLNMATKAVGKSPEILASMAGASTGTGGAIAEAANAERVGGNTAKIFNAHITGAAPIEDIVPMAKKAVKVLRQKGLEIYKAKQAITNADPEVLNVDSIYNAVKANTVNGKFKDFVIDDAAVSTRNEILAKIDEFNKLNRAEYHTVEGLDSLKKTIEAIRQKTTPRTMSNAIATNAFKAIRDSIVKQAPLYDETMKGFENMMRTVKDLENTFSIGDKAGIQTSISKLQSILRNNVNTGFGHRVNMAKILADNGATDLLAAIAGQSLNPWMGRGIPGAIAVNSATTAGLATGNPAVLLGLPFQSPRVMGRTAQMIGRVAGVMDKANIGGKVAPFKGANRAVGVLNQTQRVNQQQDKNQ